jgi:hypothetical protein
VSGPPAFPASRPETLRPAGIERAGSFVLSASGAADNPEVIRLGVAGSRRTPEQIDRERGCAST